MVNHLSNMAFKLGKAKRGFNTPPIVRKSLAKGILGEANKDGSIYINEKIKPGSKLEKKVYNHEKQHQDDMKAGILDYGDDFVRYHDKTYHRKDGKIVPMNDDLISALRYCIMSLRKARLKIYEPLQQFTDSEFNVFAR